MHAKKFLVVAFVSAALAISASAEAAVVSYNVTLPVDPTNAGAVGTVVTGTYLMNQSGTVDGTRRSPWQPSVNQTNGTFAETGKYHSVQGNSSAAYVFTSVQNFLSMMWGSPDSFNNLTLFKDGNQVFTLNGGTVKGFSTDPSASTSVGFANVLITDVMFDRVLLASGQNAFEYSKLVTPIPAAGLLLLSGLLGLGWLRRRHGSSDSSDRVGSLSAA